VRDQRCSELVRRLTSACLATGQSDVDRLIYLKVDALSKCSLAYLYSLSLSAEMYDPIDYNGTHPVGERRTRLHVICMCTARCQSIQIEWTSRPSTKMTGTLASVTVDGGRLRSLASRKL